jgi:hypothetical protein
MQEYETIPTLAKWQSDSSVMMATRQSDPILSQIDALIGAFHEARGGFRRPIALDLYFSIDYWLKSYKTNPAMENGREPAMMVLYKCVVEFLCDAFKVTVNVLPRELDMMFGRELSKVGIKTDILYSKARYLERKELDKYKLWFKNGLVYRWTFSTEKGMRTLLNTAELHNAASFVSTDEEQAPNTNYCQFVMTMGRDFYMNRHEPGDEQKLNGFFHSSYLAGQAIMAAGSMLVEHGRVKRIRSDSGHYKPVDTNMMATLQALKMLGAPLHDTIIENFRGFNPVSAAEFLRAQANWSELRKTHVQNRQLRPKLQKKQQETIKEAEENRRARIKQSMGNSAELPKDTGYGYGSEADEE